METYLHVIHPVFVLFLCFLTESSSVDGEILISSVLFSVLVFSISVRMPFGLDGMLVIVATNCA